MDSSTPPAEGFQPVDLDRNPIIRHLNPWEIARLLELEAEHLLELCFPGWARSGDPGMRDQWRLVCQEILLQSGMLIADAWLVLNPNGRADIMARTSAQGLRLVISMASGERSQVVHLVDSIMDELKRDRWIGAPENGDAFTFLSILRTGYLVARKGTDRSPSMLPRDLATFFVGAWKHDLTSTVTGSESTSPSPTTAP